MQKRAATAAVWEQSQCNDESSSSTTTYLLLRSLLCATAARSILVLPLHTENRSNLWNSGSHSDKAIKVQVQPTTIEGAGHLQHSGETESENEEEEDLETNEE
jgi:hypothetical protein